MFLGKVFPVLILFLITILYSRKLNFDEYGKFQSVWMYANIINVIISFGLSAIILSTPLNFLFSFIKNNRERLSIFYSVLWITGLTVLFFFAKNFNTSLKFLLIVFIIIQNITTIVETLLIKQQGEKASFVINSFYSLLFLGWHVYVLWINYSLAFLIIGVCILTVLKLIAMILVPAKKEFYEDTIEQKHFLSHWAYLGINDALGVISKWMDKIFLLYLLTATDFAIFFNGSFEIPLFGLLISVAGSFLSIEISGNIRMTDKIKKLFMENFNMLSSIVFPLFFFLFFFREELFSLAFKNKYDASLPIFAISIFILPLRINNYSVILQCFSQGKRILWGSVLDIGIALTLMISLYPSMGTKGIALAVVIATYCQAFFYLWYSSKILKISIFQILPLQRLVLKLLIIFSLYFSFSFILSGVELKLKLAISFISTVIIIMIGIIKYLRFFLKTKTSL
ncbi:MAG: polysaccharide biosynthesis C-terminal domain-containing protein [Ginsengibacter sp.]